MVRAVFQEEIAQQSVSLEIVRSKISGHPELQNESPKQVLDKVCSQWRYKQETATEPLDLPSEKRDTGTASPENPGGPSRHQ